MFGESSRCVVLVGAQWGDEGKGKITDVLAEQATIVARYQGGANAGHTVQTGGEEFILHLIPSGALYPTVRCLLGNGVVVDPWTLCEEIEALEARGVAIRERLGISWRAHLVMPYHKLVDKESAASKAIGTTGRGIGPCYEDKVARRGVRVLDLRHPERLKALVDSPLITHWLVYTDTATRAEVGLALLYCEASSALTASSLSSPLPLPGPG